jgi:hypothetical protein
MQFNNGKMNLKISVLGFFTILLFSCSRDKKKIIDVEVIKLVTDFRGDKINECRAALLRDAERMVDSVLLAEAKVALSDSLARNKPLKPVKPAPIAPIDSAQVKQLF